MLKKKRGNWKNLQFFIMAKNMPKAYGRQLFAAMLAAVMMMGVIPYTPNAVIQVKAETGQDDMKKTMHLGADVISNPANPADANIAWSGDYVYYGNYYQTDATGAKKDPIKWRVLDNNRGGLDKTNNLSSEEDAMLLLSDGIVDQVQFNEFRSDGNVWADSNLKKWLNSADGTVYQSANSDSYTADGFLDTAFGEKEQTAIKNSKGTAGANTQVTSSYDITLTNPAIDEGNGAKIFCLTAADGQNNSYGFYNNGSVNNNSRKLDVSAYAKGEGAYYSSSNGIWWLRSADISTSDLAGVVDSDGWMGSGYVNHNGIGVAPAFNLHLSSFHLPPKAANPPEP